MKLTMYLLLVKIKLVNSKGTVAKLPGFNQMTGSNWPISGFAGSVSAMGAWQYLPTQSMLLYFTLKLTRPQRWCRFNV
jgi:hypothetical protein